MYYFTADEHYGHKNIIKYCNRPFSTVKEMNETLIENHNKVVTNKDVVVHAGDFTLDKNAYTYIHQLNGDHVFIRGSHDYWMSKAFSEIWEKKIDGMSVVVCHYAMRKWAKSHFNSWNLHGHSHGNLPSAGKQYDVGVDCNDFTPVSFKQIKKIMETKPDNFDLITENDRTRR